jgi:hypothetical protein
LVFGGREVLSCRGAVETCAEVPCALLFAGGEVVSLETGAMVARAVTRNRVGFIVYFGSVAHVVLDHSSSACQDFAREGL